MPGRKELWGYGTSFTARRWLALDISGLLGISLSIGVHTYAAATLYLVVISNNVLSSILYYMGYVPCAVLAMVSLYQASTTNPGAVPLGAQPFTTLRRAASGEMVPTVKVGKNGKNKRATIRRCHKCDNNYKPTRAHHDSVTGRCIVKFDHYCPWVNNAVGALNHKFFCLFLLYTAISCILSLILLLVRMIQCGYVRDESGDSQDAIRLELTGDPTDDTRLLTSTEAATVSHYVYPACEDFVGSHFVTALTICSFVFLIFTVAMGCEQLEAIETGQGKIARMKQSVGSTGTEYATVTQEFNEMFGGEGLRASWHWFVPIPVRFPRGMKQVVLGYEFHEECAGRVYEEPDVEAQNNGSPSSSSSLRISSSPKAPPPTPEKDGLMREASTDTTMTSSSLNRRPNSRANSDEDEGISMVERSKARLV